MFPGVAFYAKLGVRKKKKSWILLTVFGQHQAKVQEQIALIANALNSASDTIHLAVENCFFLLCFVC